MEFMGIVRIGGGQKNFIRIVSNGGIWFSGVEVSGSVSTELVRLLRVLCVALYMKNVTSADICGMWKDTVKRKLRSS
jgi:hypothetical protein